MPTDSFVTLRDPDGTTALIAPALGGWCLRYARPLPGHGLVEGLHDDPAAVARYPREMYAGNPILFPLASKNVLDGQDHRYAWRGRPFDMPQHGFARRLPWAVLDRSDTHVAMELADHETTRAQYPFAFRLQLVYRLRQGQLHWEQTVENRGDEPLPFSTGFHPYIPIPLTPRGRRDACYVSLPDCRRYTWTGHYERFTPQPFPATRWSVMTDVVDSLLLDGFARPELTLQDEASGVEVHLDFAQAPHHRFVVVWSRSPADPFYCLEPWTALPNAFSRLDSGELTILPPGAVFRAAMHLEVRPM